MKTLPEKDQRTVKKTTLNVNDIFFSLQGEGSFSGIPTTFVRLTGCNLRCSWCDTQYAYYGKNNRPLDEIIQKVQSFPAQMVSITGGEPLYQNENSAIELIEKLHELGKKISMETNGSYSIKNLPEYVHIILDLKAPLSGETESNDFQNLQYLKTTDEIKIIIGDDKDFLWAQAIFDKYQFRNNPCKIYLQPVYERLPASTLAEWIIRSEYPFSLSVQLHKLCFGSNLK